MMPVSAPPASLPSGGGAGDGDLDPAHPGRHLRVDDLLEAEGIDVEVERAVGVGDGHAHTADAVDVELGLKPCHLESPPR